MATAAPPQMHPIVRDRLFFFVMAVFVVASLIQHA